jgi:hypothetical protein
MAVINVNGEIYMKKMVFSALFFISWLVFAQETTVIIAPFEAHSVVKEEDAQQIVSMFGEKFSAHTAVRVIPKSTLTRHLGKRAFFDRDWHNPSKAVPVALELNAGWILLGTLRETEGVFDVKIQALSSSGETAEQAEVSIANLNELDSKMDELVESVLIALGNDNTRMIPVAGDLFNIGDKGPAGGIVFYDKGSYKDGWRYLEAAPVEVEMSAEWGSFSKSVIGTKEEIGAGKTNTRIIYEYLKSYGEKGRAAQLCYELEYGGYKDWFLPSKAEMELAFSNLKQRGKGEFRNGWYWTSTSVRNDYALYFDFENGKQIIGQKDRKMSFRPVRSF